MVRAANRGTAVHAFLEDIAVGVTTDVAIERMPAEYQELCSKLDTRVLVPPAGYRKAEVAFVYNALSHVSRISGYSKGRQYGDLYRGDIPGTADLLYKKRKGSPYHIRDYKTGKTKVDPAKENAQLMFFGLCLETGQGGEPPFDLLGTDRRADIAYIDTEGNVTFDQALYTSERLGVFADDIEAMYLRCEDVKKNGPTWLDVVKGKHCRFCDSRMECKEIR
jgi:hypothetical protein